MSTVRIASFNTICSLQREWSCAIGFSWNGRTHNNSCKWTAYWLYSSFIIVHTERGQWQASHMREKSACLLEVSVMKRLYGNFRNWVCANIVYQGLFSLPMHKSLGTRLGCGCDMERKLIGVSVKLLVEGNFSANELAQNFIMVFVRYICVGLRPLCSWSEWGQGIAILHT